MDNAVPLGNYCFLYPAAYCLWSVCPWKKHGQSHSEFDTKIFHTDWLFLLSCLTFYLDHGKLSKSITIQLEIYKI